MSRIPLSWAPDNFVAGKLLRDGSETVKFSVDVDECVRKVDSNLQREPSEYRHRIRADGHSEYGSAVKAVREVAESGLVVESRPRWDEFLRSEETPISREYADSVSGDVVDKCDDIEEALEQTDLETAGYCHSGGVLTEFGELEGVVSSAEGMSLGVRAIVDNSEGKRVASVGYWRDGKFGWVKSGRYSGELAPETEEALDDTVDYVTDRRIDDEA